MVRNDNLLAKQRGFTLAEVLITLGIIGVVAALTIPTLMQKTNRNEILSKFKKCYSTLANAYSLAYAHNGSPEKLNLKYDSSSEDATILADYLKPYLNIAKDCGIDGTGCVGQGFYKKFDGSQRGDYSSSEQFYKILLNDGSALLFRSNNGSSGDILLFVDINGPKAPNQEAVDFFAFWLSKDGKLVPHNTGICEKGNVVHADSCSAYILKYDNLDYLD